MTNMERIVIGALGGLAAVMVKFLGQDYATVVAQAANLTAEQITAYKVGYGLLTPILMFLGGFVAWTSEERKRLKLVALAVAAPALITTWSGGTKPDYMASTDFLIAPAYAQPSGGQALPAPTTTRPAAPEDKSVLDQIKQGVGVFFGYGKEPKRYWVIVGSFNKRHDAQRFADRINGEDRSLNAWVGVRVPPNDFYPVIVGGYSTLSQAKALKERALATDAVTEAYLSTGAKR
ncbi:MAG TPA: SPOR domain-containing protein [Gammaproteobacteria bacterium]|nr:SPOR domain-containing protein [Gammaproteobacteria bacterium]